jgi:hypothetical protein
MAKRAEIEGTGKQIKAYLTPIVSEMDDHKNYRMQFILIDPLIEREE